MCASKDMFARYKDVAVRISNKNMSANKDMSVNKTCKYEAEKNASIDWALSSAFKDMSESIESSDAYEKKNVKINLKTSVLEMHPRICQQGMKLNTWQ